MVNKYILKGILPVMPHNGRIYSKEMMDKALKDFLEKNKNIIREKKLKRILDGV